MIASSNVTYKTIAYLLLVGNVQSKQFADFKRGNGGMLFTDKEQAYFFWYVVTEWCVYCAEHGHFNYKGLENVGSTSASSSSSQASVVDRVSAVKATAASKLAGLLGALGADPDEQQAKFDAHFFVYTSVEGSMLQFESES
jgi:hypothetical protein